MAIYAQRSGTVSLAGLLSNVMVDDTVQDGAVLIWNDAAQAFVLQNPNTLIVPIDNVDTFGGEGVNTVNGGVVGDTLYFKEIIAGSGITVENTDTTLTINSSLASNTLSVPGDYKITINNNATLPNSKFEIYTAGTPLFSPKYIDFLPTVLPITVPYVYTENVAGHGVFKTVNGFDFVASNFVPGQKILVSNSVNQDNLWTILSVTTGAEGSDVVSRITLVEEFTGDYALNLGGPTPDVEILQLDLFVSSPGYALPYPYEQDKFYQLSSVSVDFGPSGQNLLAGMIVHIQNSLDGSFDGAYVVASVEPKGAGPFDYSTVLFQASSPLPANEPIIPRDTFNPDLRFAIEHFETSTGFSVDTEGNVTASKVSVTEPPINNNELTNKEYVDATVANTARVSAKLFFLASI